MFHYQIHGLGALFPRVDLMTETQCQDLQIGMLDSWSKAQRHKKGCFKAFFFLVVAIVRRFINGLSFNVYLHGEERREKVYHKEEL
jgi:hypothetical protein